MVKLNVILIYQKSLKNRKFAQGRNILFPQSTKLVDFFPFRGKHIVILILVAGNVQIFHYTSNKVYNSINQSSVQNLFLIRNFNIRNYLL